MIPVGSEVELSWRFYQGESKMATVQPKKPELLVRMKGKYYQTNGLRRSVT